MQQQSSVVSEHVAEQKHHFGIKVAVHIVRRCYYTYSTVHKHKLCLNYQASQCHCNNSILKLRSMEVLQVVVFLNMMAHILCQISYSNMSNALIEVPTIIPFDVDVVNLSRNQISSLDGKLNHIAALQELNLEKNMITSCPNCLDANE